MCTPAVHHEAKWVHSVPQPYIIKPTPNRRSPGSLRARQSNQPRGCVMPLAEAVP